jgi:hypothetical protein
MGTVSAVCKKRKAAGQRPFSSAEWSSRGHAQGKGLAECPGRLFVSTDPRTTMHALCFNGVS